MYIFKKADTDRTIYVELRDSTTGAALTGLAYNSAGAFCYYTLPRGTATQITLATLAAANSAHSDGGFKEVSSSNAPGLYRLDLPDTPGATEDFFIVTIGFTGARTESVYCYCGTNTAADIYNFLTSANFVETGISLAQAMKVVLAALAGKLTGAATTSVVIRDVADSKDRITATVDSNGNRSAVTLDLT